MSPLSGLDAALDAVAGPVPAAPRPAPPEPYRPGLQSVRVEEVYPDPGNPRERMGDIDGLASSIHLTGLIQPIIARVDTDGCLVVVAGHRRLEAVKRLGWLWVEVIVRRDIASDDQLVKALIENGHRAGLDPIEEARGFARLKAQEDLSDAQVGARVGRNQPYTATTKHTGGEP